jgi:hypothetical protein
MAQLVLSVRLCYSLDWSTLIRMAKESSPVHSAGPPCRAQENCRPQDNRPAGGTYRFLVVAAAPDARRAQFALFVKRAVEHARTQRGWTVGQILEQAGAGLSRSTLYRWIRGDWKADPLPAQVVAFCDALDIPTAAAFTILWPGKSNRVQPTEPLQLNPDIETLARRINDPNISEQEKYMIREVLRSLAARGSRTAPRATEEGHAS